MWRIESIFERLFLHPYSAKLRTASNLFANLYTLVVALIFVPLYINYIGIEAYGLIGAFNGITSFLWLFDFGVGTNINRELSRFYEEDDRRELLDIKRTLELLCYAITSVLTVFLFGLIFVLAYYWLRNDNFSPEYILSVLAILALSLAVQFPTAFYTNGLMGLSRQMLLNSVTIAANTVKCVGAFAAVVYFDDRLRAFLIFQLLVALAQMLILKLALDKSINEPGYNGKFRAGLISRFRRFASELFANNLVTILLTQSDKVILSRVLTLESFGYYSLAFSIVTMTLNLFSNSITNVVFPNFARLATSDNTELLVKNFHLSTRVMAWGAASIGLVLTFFSSEILIVWTNNQDVAEKAGPILSVLALAFTLNIVMMVPYYLQHACGRSNVSLRFNLIALVFSIPAFIFASIYFGGLGAAVCWLVMQVVYFFTFVPVIRNRFLPFNLRNWYFSDFGIPMILGAAIATVFYFSKPESMGRIWLALLIGACFACVAAVSFVFSGLKGYAFEIGLFGRLTKS